MYQIQLQNLMTANYLQTFRNNMSGSHTNQSNGSGLYENKKETNAKKRKHNQVDNVPEGEDECDDEEGHGEDKQTASNSNKSSPQHSPSGCLAKSGGSKNSLKFKTASSYNNPAKLMKKSSKHVI